MAWLTRRAGSGCQWRKVLEGRWRKLRVKEGRILEVTPHEMAGCLFVLLLFVLAVWDMKLFWIALALFAIIGPRIRINSDRKKAPPDNEQGY